MDLREEKNGNYVFDIKSKLLVSTERPIVRQKGRGSTYIAIIFVIALALMVAFIILGIADPDPVGGRSLVSFSLYPAFLVNLLGARYVIRGLSAPR